MSELSRPGDLARPRALLAAARLAARRFRVVRWAVALLLGAGVAWWTSGIIADAERHRALWATTSQVWVLTADVAAGTMLQNDQLELRALPTIAVPNRALRGDGAPPAGRRLRVEGHLGEILIESRVAPAGASLVAALLPDSTRGVVIPTDEASPMQVGDQADLFDLATGRRIVDAASVVAVSPGGTTFAVGIEHVGSVIAALSAGGVVAALAP